MPSGLFLPFALGMYTLRTGLGSKVLALSCSLSSANFLSGGSLNVVMDSWSTPAVSLPVFVLTFPHAARSHWSFQSRSQRFSNWCSGSRLAFRLSSFCISSTFTGTIPFPCVGSITFAAGVSKGYGPSPLGFFDSSLPMWTALPSSDYYALSATSQGHWSFVQGLPFPHSHPP